MRQYALALGLVAMGLAMPTVSAQAEAPVSSSTVSTAAEKDPGYGRIMLLLDSSGSMAEKGKNGKSKIAEAKIALRRVVQRVPEEVEVGFRVFGAGDFKNGQAGSCTDSQSVVPPALDNRAALNDAITSYTPSGETPIPYALEQAAKDLGTEGDRSIVLISDGESSCAPDPCVTAEKIRKAGVNLKIDVVGFSVNGKTRKQLQCVAKAGGGAYYDAKDSKDLEDKIIKSADRTVPPFDLTGTAIEGGSTESPTDITVGDWTDVLGGKGTTEGTLAYSFNRLRPDTTLRVSAIAQGKPVDDGISLEIYNEANTRCDVGEYSRKGFTLKVLGVQAVASPATLCGEAGFYRIVLRRTVGTNPESIPVGLRVSEEPAVATEGYGTTDRAKVVAPQVSGDAKQVLGGGSFNSASPIGPGSYQTTIQPGGMLFFKVPLEYGQAMRLSVTFDAVSTETREAVGMFGLLGEVTLYTPMQAIAAEPEAGARGGLAGTETPLALLTATPQVSATSFTRAYSKPGDYDFTLEGDYYIGISLQAEDYVYDFPLTINVAVDGEAQKYSSYAEGASWTLEDGAVYPDSDPKPEVANKPDETKKSDKPAAAQDSGSSLGGLVKGGAIVLLLGAGAWYVVKRKKN